MAIDPSIALGVRPVQLANPLEQYMQVQQIQQAQNQSRLADLMYGEKQQQVARGRSLRDLAKGWNADTTDEQRIDSLKNSAFFDEADKLEGTLQNRTKVKADAAKAQAEAQAKHFDTLTKANGLIGSAAGAIVQNPTYDNAVQVVRGLQQQFGPDLSKQYGLDALEIPQDPAQLKAWAQNHYLGSIDTGKQLDDARARFEGNANRKSQERIAAGHDSTSRANNRDSNANAVKLEEMRGQREATQTQVVVDPNQGPLLINKATKTAVPATFADGTRVPGENAVAAGKLNAQLKEGIAQARQLIPLATASGAGALVDKGAAFFGKSTAGADAAAQLDTLAGWMTSNVPRMQGPQSDKDVLLYRQMAGDVSNRSLPASRRLAALDTLEKLQNKYADINQGSAAPASTPAPTSNAPAADGVPADIAALLKKHGGK